MPVQSKERRFFYHQQLQVKIYLAIDYGYIFLCDEVQVRTQSHYWLNLLCRKKGHLVYKINNHLYHGLQQLQIVNSFTDEIRKKKGSVGKVD